MSNTLLESLWARVDANIGAQVGDIVERVSDGSRWRVEE